MNAIPLTLKSLVKCVALTVVLSLTSPAAVPPGWLLAGTHPAEYDVGTDPQAKYNDHTSIYLKSKDPGLCAEELKLPPAAGNPWSGCNKFGTLMQNFSATEYTQKRVRLSAFVKSEAVADWAGLWMRIDKGTTMIILDNMQSRPIRGTTGWQKYEVVLDVPKEATAIAFGILLSGPGTVWMNNVQIEVVGNDVPVTATPYRHEGPTNLGFEGENK